MSRAEDRMLQQAIEASLLEEPQTGTPTKTHNELRAGLTAVYNPIFRDQGRSEVVPIDVEKLPASVHSDGFSVLGPEEIDMIRNVTEGHLRFMKGKTQAPIIAHLLGPQNIALLDGLVTTRNIRECEINMNFRLFDLLSLLSFKFTTDAVLTCYMHYLSSIFPNVYFMNPCVYKYVEDFERTGLQITPDWMLHDYLVWPLNLGNNHWVVALMKTEGGSTVYYCDSMNGTDIAREKAAMPHNLISVINMLGDSCSPPRRWNPEIEVILVPRQEKKHNDCGCCVNELARAFAHDPESFFKGDFDVNFESLSLRCTQAATLLKWLHHDVCL